MTVILLRSFLVYHDGYTLYLSLMLSIVHVTALNFCMSCVVSTDILRRFGHVVMLIIILFSQPSSSWPNCPPPNQFQFPSQQWPTYMSGLLPPAQSYAPPALPGYPPMGMPYPYPFPPYYMGGPPMGPPGSGSTAAGPSANPSAGVPAAAGAAPAATITASSTSSAGSAPPIVPRQPRAPVVTGASRPPRGSTPDGYFYDEDGVLTAIPVPNIGESDEDDDDDDGHRPPSPVPTPVPGSRPDAFKGFKERAKPGTSAEQRLAAEWRRLLGVSPAEPGAAPWSKYQFTDTFKKWGSELVFPVPQPNSALPASSQAKPFTAIQKQAAALGHAATANFDHVYNISDDISDFLVKAGFPDAATEIQRNFDKKLKDLPVFAAAEANLHLVVDMHNQITDYRRFMDIPYESFMRVANTNLRNMPPSFEYLFDPKKLDNTTGKDVPLPTYLAKLKPYQRGGGSSSNRYGGYGNRGGGRQSQQHHNQQVQFDQQQQSQLPFPGNDAVQGGGRANARRNDRRDDRPAPKTPQRRGGGGGGGGSGNNNNNNKRRGPRH